MRDIKWDKFRESKDTPWGTGDITVACGIFNVYDVTGLSTVEIEKIYPETKTPEEFAKKISVAGGKRKPWVYKGYRNGSHRFAWEDAWGNMKYLYVTIIDTTNNEDLPWGEGLFKIRCATKGGTPYNTGDVLGIRSSDIIEDCYYDSKSPGDFAKKIRNASEWKATLILENKSIRSEKVIYTFLVTYPWKKDMNYAYVYVGKDN